MRSSRELWEAHKGELPNTEETNGPLTGPRRLHGPLRAPQGHRTTGLTAHKEGLCFSMVLRIPRGYEGRI